MKIQTPNIRITGVDKNYWLNQLQDFADSLDEKKYSRVEFGKQDIRGGICITLFSLKHCVSKRWEFDSKDKMLGFVQGYNEVKEGLNK